mgnify:CR=1 FL=1
MADLSLDMMKRHWPHADSRIPGLIEGIVGAASTVFAKYGLTTPLVVAHAMAQFSHECGAGTEMVAGITVKETAIGTDNKAIRLGIYESGGVLTLQVQEFNSTSSAR